MKNIPTYRQCSCCGLILDYNRVPLKEHRAKFVLYMSQDICTVCQAEGRSFDDNPIVEQNIREPQPKNNLAKMIASIEESPRQKALMDATNFLIDSYKKGDNEQFSG